MAMTPEAMQAVAQMIAMALQQAGVGGAVGGGRERRGKAAIDTKGIKFRDFDGTQADWEQWVHSFKSAIRSANPDVLELMQEAEKMTGEAKDENLECEMDDEEAEKMSGELYNILSQYCTGEALTIVRGVNTFEGFLAWQKLYRKFSPKTMARAIRLMSEVASPRTIKDLKDVEEAIVNWENRVKKLDSEFGEKLSDTMKTAIMTSMMPTVIQDFIYTNVDDNTKYQAVVERVRSWVGNKVAMLQGPAPMDVGEVLTGQWEEEPHEWEESYVQAVGANTQCHRCGGWGHIARDCPSSPGKAKGKGKDGFKGKGSGNDHGRKGPIFGAKGAGPKGKGKGYQGTCWTCGLVGHKSSECRHRHEQANHVTEISDDIGHVEADVGGVWMVGAVSVKEDVRDVDLGIPPGLGRPVANRSRHHRRPGLIVGNRFSALMPTAGDDQDGDTDYNEEGCTLIGNEVEEIGRGKTVNEGEDSDAREVTWRLMRGKTVDIGMVEGGNTTTRKLTRESGMKFTVANVQKPLASAVKVVEAGNRISMGPRPGDNFIENGETGEKIGLRVEKGTYVFDVEVKGGEASTITLDSGAGVNVWPDRLQKHVPMQPRDPRLRMMAANGSEIENLGSKLIHFKGYEPDFTGRA